MATSSIFHNFVIDDEETLERFLDAFEASLNEEVPPIPDSIQILRDPEEIKAAMERQDRYLEARRQRLEAEKNAG